MTVQDDTTTETHGAVLTDAAAAKAKALLDQEGRDDLALRIAVQPGGCAGLRYNLFFDDRTLDGDLEAFTTLHRRYYARIYRLALYRCRTCGRRWRCWWNPCCLEVTEGDRDSTSQVQAVSH